MHRTRRWLLVAIMTAALPLGLMTGTASAAPVSHAAVRTAAVRTAAATYSLDNTDPAATGCWDGSAKVVSQENIYDQR